MRLLHTRVDFGSEETQFAAQRWVDLLRHMIPPGPISEKSLA
jgi:hypothetical protein